MTRICWVLLALAAPAAHAEPWLCTRPGGLKEFSYDPQSAADRKCVDTPISRGYVRRTPSAAGEMRGGDDDFPRVDRKTQRRRDEARRDILERELAAERRALADATRELERLKELRVDSTAPQVVREYEQRIRTHRTNIANIEKELGGAG